MLSKSEFASLSDLVIERGFLHSELLSEIQEKILRKYHEDFGEEAQTVEVVIDEKTGKVNLFQDKNNVTPKGFSAIAEKLAREVLIEKLKETNVRIEREEKKEEDKEEKEAQIISEEVETEVKKKRSDLGKWIMTLIFWGYNILYLFIILGFLIQLLTNTTLRESIVKEIQTQGIYKITFIVIAWMVPLISIISALMLVKKKIYDHFGTLFFLFEIPLVAVSLFFSGFLTSASPMMWFFFIVIVFSIPVVLVSVMNIQIKSNKVLAALLFLRQSVFLFSAYISLLFSFIVPLILGYIATTVFDFFSEEIFGIGVSYYSHTDPITLIFTMLLGGLYLLIILALASAPYLVTYYLARVFLNARKVFSDAVGENFGKKIVLAFIFIWIFLFAVVSYQPNSDKLIERLGELRKKSSFEEREAIARDLVSQETKIRKAFSDLQNVRTRYLMAKSDDYIKEAYVDVLNMGDFSAGLVQDAFMTASYPFIYHGSLDRNNEALNNFQYLFGESYYTYKTYSPPIETKNVSLVYRKIEATTDYEKLFATVSVEEEYTTSSTQDQEVIYEFYLPEDSVITGLRLGPNLEFEGIIAPRGAALTTYQQQVRRSRDPALLEQTGPNQYRLRIFPIPRKIRSSILMGNNQKVRFTYITSADSGGYAIPVYSKEQNVSVNDKYISSTIDGNMAEISDNHIKISGDESIYKNICESNKTTQIRSPFSSATLYLVSNSSFVKNATSKCIDGKPNLMGNAKDLNFAVIFDVSYKNKDTEMRKEMEKLFKDNTDFLKNNNVDYYKFNDIVSKGNKLTDKNLSEVFGFTYFGEGEWYGAVNSIKGKYDFIIILTNSEDLISQSSSIVRNFPIYVVHEGLLPPYVSKITSDVVQSGGSSFDNFEDAINTGILRKMKYPLEGKNYLLSGSNFSYYTDANAAELLTQQSWQNITSDKSDSASVLFARKYLNEKFFLKTGNIETDLVFKDSTNKFALGNSIVAPYSSLIALVNETQLQMLENLSQSLDRYKESQTTTSGNWESVNLNPPTGFSPLEDIGGGLFGANLKSFSVPTDGEVNLSAPGAFSGRQAYSIGGGGSGASSSLFSGFGSGLVMINAVIFGVGVIIFIVIKIKNRKKKV